MATTQSHVFDFEGIPVGALGRDGIVGVDVSCRQCDYNLRGLHRDEACPECGHAIDDSLKGNGLKFESPKWIKQLSYGALSLSIGIGCTIFFFLTRQFIYINFDFLFYIPYFMLGIVLPLFSIPFYVLGYWNVTRPSPSKITRQASRIGWRGFARWSLIIVTLLPAMEWFFHISGVITYKLVIGQASSSTFFAQYIGLFSTYGATTMWYCGVVALLIHVQRLVMRSANKKLANQLRQIRFLLVGTACLHICVIPVYIYMAPQHDRSAPPVYFLFITFFICKLACLAIFSIWSFVLTIRFRNTLSITYKEASSIQRERDRTWKL